MVWDERKFRVDNAMEDIGNLPPETGQEEYRTQRVLWEAGRLLRDEVARLRKEHELLKIHTTEVLAREQKPLVEGDTLVPGWDGGGFRHFLAGEPVRNGTGLRLLTAIGWLPGRYESRPASDDEREREGWFHFYLPGVDFDVAVPISREARLAWPSQFERPGRY